MYSRGKRDPYKGKIIRIGKDAEEVDPETQLLDMENGAATQKSCLAVSTRGTELAQDPAIPVKIVPPRELNTRGHAHMHNRPQQRPS